MAEALGIEIAVGAIAVWFAGKALQTLGGVGNAFLLVVGLIVGVVSIAVAVVLLSSARLAKHSLMLLAEL